MEKMRYVWAEIDLDALAHNMREIKKASKSEEVMAVVKADAYGHGAIDVAPVLLENGATSLAVAVISEALELRRAGIEAPIMILGHTPLEYAEEIVAYDIQQTVFSFDYAQELSKEAQRQNKKVRLHIALDTGMGRIGFLPTEESIEEIINISKLTNVSIMGVFSHFSSADEENKSYTKEQLQKFLSFIEELKKRGINPKILHIANSAAIIDLPDTHFHEVRPGIILYGYLPSKEVNNKVLDIKPVLTLKAKIVHIKTLEKDMYVSYGRIFKTERKSIIATLPLGYADGYTRLLTNKAKAIVGGKLVPVVGRICMDQCMLDITDVPSLKVGDEVILLGEDKGVHFNAEDIADLLGTINYEVLCMLGSRVPRVYIKDGKVLKIRNYI
ncbi:alanine racemase [Alloiococcus sp. CFN-8]|uniref:alanine racemase n=1 Tax=Alloiococcus sp. CFN-8 TaxID=3416081 RepID=UPI003CF2244B